MPATTGGPFEPAGRDGTEFESQWVPQQPRKVLLHAEAVAESPLPSWTGVCVCVFGPQLTPAQTNR